MWRRKNANGSTSCSPATARTKAEHEAYVAERQIEAFPYVISQELGVAFRVGKLPYAALLDEKGVLVAKGLVNSREHLESLLEAKRLGVASVNEYMSAKARDETEVNYMNWLDNWITKGTRRVARHTSRRDFLSRMGVVLVGAGAVPLLPVARANAAEGARAPQPQEKGDPLSCDYWRFCALDGFLCGCCGGSTNSCPPGTEASPVTWIGTCRNPVDCEGLHHFVQRLLR